MPLDALDEGDEALVGGKAVTTARLARAGFEVPLGFALTTGAYEAFVSAGGLGPAIRVELGRKWMGDMRWEEIWDTALRIRSLFHAHPIPDEVREAIAAGLRAFAPGTSVAVRSSATAEGITAQAQVEAGMLALAIRWVTREAMVPMSCWPVSPISTSGLLGKSLMIRSIDLILCWFST